MREKDQLCPCINTEHNSQSSKTYIHWPTLQGNGTDKQRRENNYISYIIYYTIKKTYILLIIDSKRMSKREEKHLYPHDHNT